MLFFLLKWPWFLVRKFCMSQLWAAAIIQCRGWLLLRRSSFEPLLFGFFVSKSKKKETEPWKNLKEKQQFPCCCRKKVRFTSKQFFLETFKKKNNLIEIVLKHFRSRVLKQSLLKAYFFKKKKDCCFQKHRQMVEHSKNPL